MLSDRPPQLLTRVGYASTAVEATPRRPLESVLVNR